MRRQVAVGEPGRAGAVGAAQPACSALPGLALAQHRSGELARDVSLCCSPNHHHTSSRSRNAVLRKPDPKHQWPLGQPRRLDARRHHRRLPQPGPHLHPVYLPGACDQLVFLCACRRSIDASLAVSWRGSDGSTASAGEARRLRSTTLGSSASPRRLLALDRCSCSRANTSLRLPFRSSMSRQRCLPSTLPPPASPFEPPATARPGSRPPCSLRPASTSS
jgi:hypothetical protein